MNAVKILDADDSQRVFFCGDVHGEYELLISKLEEINFSDNDVLVFVGDLIDRGPDSIKCLQMLDRPNVHSVLGNHELMAINYLAKPSYQAGSLWFNNGGEWFSDLECQGRCSEARKSLAKAEELPKIIEVNYKGKKVVVCHADYPHNDYCGYSDGMEHDIVWNRERVYNSLQSGGVEIIGADAFVFGHTPIKVPTNIKNQVYIDTGAVFGYRLTLINIDDVLSMVGANE